MQNLTILNYKFPTFTSNYPQLAQLIANLPCLAKRSLLRTESESIAQEQVTNQISAVLDRCDVPGPDSPLHLVVKFDDLHPALAMAGAGADISFQNKAGWNPSSSSLL